MVMCTLGTGLQARSACLLPVLPDGQFPGTVQENCLSAKYPLLFFDYSLPHFQLRSFT